MATFLFWNVRRKRLELVVRRLVERHAIDVLMLAECAIPEQVMLLELNKGASDTFHRIPMRVWGGIELYSRWAPACFGPVFMEGDHYAIRVLAAPGGIEVMLVLAHLASPMWKDRQERRSQCVGFASAIQEAEKTAKNDRTVVVGDLNMNPFDDSMLDVRGLNALSDRRTIQRKDPRRFGIIRKEEFRLFYNPMWGHLGDAAAPAGTYYYDRSNSEVDPLWNIFDQVLLRPSLLDRFRSKNLKILTTDGVVSLTWDDGRPNSELFSDHLPIWFQLDLRRRTLHASS